MKIVVNAIAVRVGATAVVDIGAVAESEAAATSADCCAATKVVVIVDETNVLQDHEDIVISFGLPWNFSRHSSFRIDLGILVTRNYQWTKSYPALREFKPGSGRQAGQAKAGQPAIP